MGRRVDLYHSMLTPPLTAAPALRVTCDRGVALVHDVMAGPLPAAFERADLLYAEGVWADGWAESERRSGRPQRAYIEYLAALSRVVTGTLRPVVLVMGQRARSHLPRAKEYPIRLRGAMAVAYCYRLRPPLVGHGVSTTEELLAKLAERFAVIGDFCAGYGNSGRIFAQAGKGFVLSDVNPRCIGVIAEQVAAWGCRDIRVWRGDD